MKLRSFIDLSKQRPNFFWRFFEKVFGLFALEHFFSVCLIFSFSVYTFSFYQDQLRLDLFDESDYLFMFLSGRGVIPDWGPLYSLVYWIESFVWPDPLQLYLSHAFWISCLLPLTYYFVLLRLGKPSVYALTFSLLLVVIQWNFLLFPKAGHFAILILFFGFIIFSSSRRESSFAARMSCFLLLLSWVRPEYFLLGVLYFFCRRFWPGWNRPKIDAVSVGLFVVVALLWFVLGSPFHGGLRIWAAITQGLQWTGEFRGDSVGGVLLFSPHLLFQHLLTNGWILLNGYPKILEFLFTRSFGSLSWANSAWIQLLLLFAPLAWFMARNKKNFLWKRSELSFFFMVYVSYFLLLSITIFANPRHFFILPFLLVGFLPLRFEVKKAPNLSSLGFLTAIFFCIWGPILFSEPTPRILSPNFDRKNVEYVRANSSQLKVSGSNSLCLSFPHAFALFLPDLCGKVEALRTLAFHGEFGILEQVHKSRPQYLIVRADYWPPHSSAPSMEEVFLRLQDLGYKKTLLPHGDETYFFSLNGEI